MLTLSTIILTFGPLELICWLSWCIVIIEVVEMTEKIRVVLVKRHISAAELARRLGVKPQSLSRKMVADNFSTKDLEEIAQVLGCEFVGSFVLKDTGESV
jgi:DNA-binding Xre family transcriptional regulator